MNDVPESGIESCAHASLWACPSTLAHPCDAWWWVELEDYDDELYDASAVARLVREIVDASVPTECLRSCEPKEPDWSCSAAACTVGGVTVDYRREWLEEEYEGHYGTETRRREEVEAHLSASTEPWMRLDFESSLRSSEDYQLEAQAAWEGAIDPSLPDDDAFHFTTRSYGSDYWYARDETWSSAGCDIAVDEGDYGGDYYEIALPGSSLGIVDVYEGWDCSATQATLDGVTYQVRDDDWRIVGIDRDGDGFSVEGGDCDDDDPERIPCEGC